MHTVDLGIWVHMMECIAVTIHATSVAGQVFTNAKDIWDEIVQRSQELDPDDCMLSVNSFRAGYLHHLWKAKQEKDRKYKKKLEAWEHHVLMLVCKLIAYCAHFVSILQILH